VLFFKQNFVSEADPPIGEISKITDRYISSNPALEIGINYMYLKF